jgi:hypothetical protein
MALKEVLCINCFRLVFVMSRSLTISSDGLCMVPWIHVVIIIGGKPFQPSLWTWGMRASYLSCLRVVVVYGTLSLQYVNPIYWIVMKIWGEKGGGGGSLGDFPLMQRMFGRSLAKHRHLGKKHKHGSSQDGRAFFGDQWELLHVCINVKCQVLGCVRIVLETKGRFTLWPWSRPTAA